MKQAVLPSTNYHGTVAPWGIWILVALLVLLAPLLGLLATTGSIFLVTIPVVLLLTLVLVFHPWLFTWIIIFSGLVVMGVIRLYAPEFQAIRWLIPFLTLGVPIVLVVMQAFKPSPAERARLPALFWWAVAFLFASLFTTLINWNGFLPAISGLKSYFQVWGLIAVFALIYYRGDFSRGLTLFLVGIALLQVPFVLQQYFYIVPVRVGFPLLVPEDVVAGTFGAELYGGGNNALLATYLFMVIGILLMLWRQKILAAWLMLPCVLLLIFPVFLNEAKVAFFYAWVMFLVLYKEDIARRPLHFILGNIVLFLFLFVFLSFYAQIAAESGKAHNLGQYLDFLKEQNLDRGYGTYVLNRWTALTFWFQEHFPHDIGHAFIGHGLGESREGALVVDVSNTVAARRYRGMGIGLTGLSSLLWDVGLIGVAMVAMMLMSAYRLAGRLAEAARERPLAMALFKGLQAGVIILGISIVHKDFFVFEMAFQSLFVLIIGYLIYSARNFSSLSASHQAGHTGLQPMNAPL